MKNHRRPRTTVELEVRLDTSDAGEVTCTAICDSRDGGVYSVVSTDAAGKAVLLTDAELERALDLLADAWQEHLESAREDYDDRMYG